MTQRLHLVFGGELKDPTTKAFRNVDEIDIVGIFPDYASAFGAWKENQIEVIDLRIALAKLLPEVAVMLQENKRDTTILSSLKSKGLNETILEKIKAKPLRLLRKTDFSKEIQQLEEGKKIVMKDTPEKLLKDCYS